MLKTIKTNYRLPVLTIKLMALIVRLSPFKPATIRALAILRCIKKLPSLRKSRKWQPIAQYAEHSGNTMARWLYVLRCYVEHEVNDLWCYLSHELPALRKSIPVYGTELLRKNLDQGKGVLLLGFHYAPLIRCVLLENLGFKSMTLHRKEHLAESHKKSQMSFGPLKLRYYEYNSDTGFRKSAGVSEKTIVRHLKNGGQVFMLNDFPLGNFIEPSDEKSGETVKYFGKTARLSAFPFKVSLRFNVPVIMTLLEKTMHGNYEMKLFEFSDFTTPREGLERYIAILEKQVENNPFMWHFLPIFFTSFFPEDSNHLMAKRRNKTG